MLLQYLKIVSLKSLNFTDRFKILVLSQQDSGIDKGGPAMAGHRPDQMFAVPYHSTSINKTFKYSNKQSNILLKQSAEDCAIHLIKSGYATAARL